MRARITRFRHFAGIPGALAVVLLMFSQSLAEFVFDLLDSPAERVATVAVFGTATLWLFTRWDKKLPVTDTGTYGAPGTSKLPTRRGAVIMLGFDSAAPDAAATKLLRALPNLDYLALIGTPETAERQIAASITTKLVPACRPGLASSHIRTWEFGNAESVSDSEQAAQEAIRWLLSRGLDPREVVLDVSAGRRAMAHGAKDAADSHQVETQYLAERWDPATNRPVKGTEAFKVIKVYYP